MKKRQRWLIRIIFSLVLLVAAVLFAPQDKILRAIFFGIPYLVIGWDILLRAIQNIFRGQVFDENFLMALATVGAFIVGEYPEAVAVMLFYQVGELFQSYAVDKSRRSISDLMDIRPDYANVRRGNEIIKADPYDVKAGEIIVIRPGEKIPLDSMVLQGGSSVDTAALTGESVPREVVPGDTLLSGCINISGLLEAQVTKEFSESTVSKILDLVENATSKKSNSENFITKFARYYTPIVVILAALLAMVPPLLISGASLSDWVYRALTFLVISCPCALVISIPLSFFGGIGGASKNGILVKGSNYLEALASAEIVAFDKTGTLTKGVFTVQEVHPQGLSEGELLKLAAHAESYSSHPISQSILKAYGAQVDSTTISDVEEIAGYGVRAQVGSRLVHAGNARLMEQVGVDSFSGDLDGTVVHVCVDASYAGYIVISDQIKQDAYQLIAGLKQQNVRQTVMLTGDRESVGQSVASALGIDKTYTGLLPADKVDQVEMLLASKSQKGKLVYVGDGINDAPVLARADIGVAMGGLGSDAAIEAADIVIMTDEPSKLVDAIMISRSTLRIVKQNIIFALGVKAVVLLLGALGLSSMWEAVFADVGVSVLAILNAMRMLNIKLRKDK